MTECARCTDLDARAVRLRPEWFSDLWGTEAGAVVLDPPWRFRGKLRHVLGYRTLTDAQIAAVPVPKIAAKDAHVYLWAPDTHLRAALDCLDVWGATLKATIPWVKRGKTGKLQIGGGSYVRKAHELCLFAVRGKLTHVHDHAVPSVIFAPRGRHSQKPELLQDYAERLSPGPRVELFARRHRPGWLCAGNELGKRRA